MLVNHFELRKLLGGDQRRQAGGMRAQQVLDLWHSPEPAWKISEDREHGEVLASHGVAAGFHLAKRNLKGTISTEDLEQAVPLLDGELEEIISSR